MNENENVNLEENEIPVIEEEEATDNMPNDDIPSIDEFEVSKAMNEAFNGIGTISETAELESKVTKLVETVILQSKIIGEHEKAITGLDDKMLTVVNGVKGLSFILGSGSVILFIINLILILTRT